MTDILIVIGVAVVLFFLFREMLTKKSRERNSLERQENVFSMKFREAFREAFPEYYQNLTPSKAVEIFRQYEKERDEIVAQAIRHENSPSKYPHPNSSKEKMAISLAPIISSDFYTEISGSPQKAEQFLSVIIASSAQTTETIAPEVSKMFKS
jgi:hypothetical protein